MNQILIILGAMRLQAMNVNDIAQERIKELEDDIKGRDAHIQEQDELIGLQNDQLYEAEEVIRSLKGQLQNLRVDRRYEVA